MHNYVLILLALFVLSCTKTTPTAEPVADSDKPNILLIIADDMGLDATPGYDVGTVKPNMPNLKKLIESGVKFTNVWSNPTCSPTRGTILTGKYGFRTNVTKVGDVMPTTETSLHKYLDANNTGYNSAVIGKWHLSNSATHPTEMGVSFYAGHLSGTADSYTSWKFTENGKTTTSTEYITSKFSNLAIDWIGKQTKPWFLWLAYTAPHTPFHLPPANLHSQTGLSGTQANITANPLPYYMAMAEAMDTEMGRVIASFDAKTLENTIIIFVGDNGTPPQVVQAYSKTRAKDSMYQGGINVPMIVSGKGVSRKNQTENGLINTTDLFSTIAELAGVGKSEINDSKSFKSLLSSSSGSKRDYVYAELGTDTGGSDYCIRNATHKYIRFESGDEALYDLSANPFENPNLLSANQLPLSTTNRTAKDALTAKLAEIRR